MSAAVAAGTLLPRLRGRLGGGPVPLAEAAAPTPPFVTFAAFGAAAPTPPFVTFAAFGAAVGGAGRRAGRPASRRAGGEHNRTPLDMGPELSASA